MVACLLCIPMTTQAFCWQEAAATYNHDPLLLQAIAEQESRYKKDALGPWVRVNGKPERAYGLMQILSIERKKLAARGLTMQELLNDGCQNVKEGARILAEKEKIVGPTWKAVGAYYAGEAGSAKNQAWYAENVKRRYDRLLAQKLPKPSPVEPTKEATAEEVTVDGEPQEQADTAPRPRASGLVYSF